MYMSSSSEVTKFTISSSFAGLIPDMIGVVYSGPKEVPEPPKQGFLKGLFGGVSSPVDRDEYFGETTAGRASKTTARLITGSSGDQPKIDSSKMTPGSFAADMAKLKEVLGVYNCWSHSLTFVFSQGVSERGERLGKLEDSTARMQNEAEVFSSAAHAVMLKYRDKKWYQF